jgi:GNAT superfamily N-acetyltransferase
MTQPPQPPDPSPGAVPAGPALGDYFVSTSADLLDLDFVCAALAGSYWAQNRPRAVIEESLKSSICFGLYEKPGARQVGLARVVTDGATFSWLCDVIVDKGHRGRGLGKLLVSSVVGDPRLRETMFLLGTRDAHGLYEKFGFVRSDIMRRQAQVMRHPSNPTPQPSPPPASSW